MEKIKEKLYNSKAYIIGFLLLIFVIIIGFKGIKGEGILIKEGPLVDKKIVIDPGHGGSDPGVILYEGTEDEIFEKDINLSLSLYLEEYLKEAGAEVLMTRKEDNALADTKQEDLNERVRVANYNEADIFISIHQNQFHDENIQGMQVFYYLDSYKGEELAQALHRSIEENINQNNEREATASKEYFVLLYTEVPAVLVECGFLTNPRDLENILDKKYQKEFAKALSLGIIEYFNE